MATKIGAFRELGGDVIPTPTGDISLSVSVAPNPYAIEYELMQIAANLHDVSKPLIGATRILADDMQRRFDTETTPDGDHWYPLDEEYLASKVSLGYPEDILHRTGKLEDAATNLDAFVVLEDSVYFNPSQLPPYGLLHQNGSGDENKGLAANHRFSARNEEGYAKREGGAHSSIGIGRGKALPARPFVGMSEEAEAEVWGLFDFWFEAATETSSTPYVHSTGTVQSRVAGRFGPKVVF